MSARIGVAMSLLVLAGSLAGCGMGENSDLKAELDDLTKDVKGHVASVPEIKPYDPFPYDASSLRDPFKPELIKAINPTNAGRFDQEMRRAKEPLEAYPLETLKMVGTLHKPGSGMGALIMSEAGLSRVVVGKYLGQNFGRITSITKSSIELREIVQDPDGEWTERTTTMNIDENEVKK
jgi:type IV pilus assembly protein PilP